MDKQPDKKPRPLWARRWEPLLAAALLAAGLLWWVLARGGAGAVARVSVTAGAEAGRSFALPLAEDALVRIDAALPVTLEVAGGAVRFIHSQCPDHLCEGFGWISHEGEWALCAPAGVLVRVEES